MPLFGPRRRVRLATKRQPSPADPGLRAAAGPPRKPVSQQKGDTGLLRDRPTPRQRRSLQNPWLLPALAQGQRVTKPDTCMEMQSLF